MNRTQRSTTRQSGLTLIETMISVGVLVVFFASVLTALAGSQSMIVTDQATSQLQLKAQSALERVLRYASQAVTTDPELSTFEDNSGRSAYGLTFRVADSISARGVISYDLASRVFIYGGKSTCCAGLVILRGPDLTTLKAKVAGPDLYFGTTDDISGYSFNGDDSALELLLTSDNLPRSGQLLSVDMSPAPVGRRITFTLRVNARDRQGRWILDSDLVLKQSVSLRQ